MIRYIHFDALRACMWFLAGWHLVELRRERRIEIENKAKKVQLA